MGEPGTTGTKLAFIIVILLTSAAFLVGCEAQPWGNRPPLEEDRIALASTLTALGADHEPRYAVVAAGPRGRWDDVDLALIWAIAEDGVEMGIVQKKEFDWGYQYDLKTVEGWPATLTVRRTDDRDARGEPRIYEATATVGRFPEMPERQTRAKLLLESFDRWMAELGSKVKPVRRE